MEAQPGPLFAMGPVPALMASQYDLDHLVNPDTGRPVSLQDLNVPPDAFAVELQARPFACGLLGGLCRGPERAAGRVRGRAAGARPPLHCLSRGASLPP